MLYSRTPFYTQSRNSYYHPHYHSHYSNVNNSDNSMNIEGEGKVKATPNIAVITLGVITEGEKLETTQEQNAIITSEVLEALSDIGIRDEDIETISYTIQQKYDYVDGKRVFRGYEVTNKFTVTIRDIEEVGEVIDIAVANGANVADNIRFEVSNPSIYYRKALTLAVEDAVRKARDIGRTLGVMVDEVPTKIIEQDYKSIYLPELPVYRAPEADTPIRAGQLEISARIKATFSY